MGKESKTFSSKWFIDRFRRDFELDKEKAEVIKDQRAKTGDSVFRTILEKLATEARNECP